MQFNTEEIKCNTVDFNAMELNKCITVEYNAIQLDTMQYKKNEIQSLQAAREQTGRTTQWTARGEINGE